VPRNAPTMPKSKSIVVGLSGRADTDVHTVETALASGNGHGSPAVTATVGGRR